jgi:cephalosporin-C deacetylase-like acetyl esterase
MVLRDNELAIHAYIPAIAYFPKALPATVWVLSFSSLFGYQYTVAVVMANDAHYGSILMDTSGFYEGWWDWDIILDWRRNIYGCKRLWVRWGCGRRQNTQLQHDELQRSVQHVIVGAMQPLQRYSYHGIATDLLRGDLSVASLYAHL